MAADNPPVPTFLDDLPLAKRAACYALSMHAGQRRESDAAPFILHPLEVASLLHMAGHQEVVITAGILHDAVENTGAELGDIETRFGDEVAWLVAAMTENPGIRSFSRRKARLREQIREFGPDATAVYAADKVAKVRELRMQLSHDPDLLATDARSAERLEHYTQSLTMLEELTPEHPLVVQLRFELEALHDLPPS